MSNRDIKIVAIAVIATAVFLFKSVAGLSDGDTSDAVFYGALGIAVSFIGAFKIIALNPIAEEPVAAS